MTKEEIGSIATVMLMVLCLIACSMLIEAAPNIGWFMTGVFTVYFIDAVVDIVCKFIIKFKQI
jgi:hypothetical protein